MDLAAFVVLAGLTALLLSFIMMGAWKVQEATHNTGWIDVSWTFGLGLVGVLMSLSHVASDPASPFRRIMVAGLFAFWSLRLGRHILKRTLSAGDDPRYRRWIEDWGADARRRMFWHLQTQAAFAVIFAIAVILAAHNAATTLRAQDILGFMVLMAALTGEAIADRQLRTFKAAPSHQGKICDIGLWSWSRHPNYFFEWLAWLAYPIIAIDVSGHDALGWLALIAPASMYWLLNYVSGIPPLEQHMQQTKGEAFRAYRQRTNAFFPWPPRDPR
jgi:steroid 5-alpha reductase family enzyme